MSLSRFSTKMARSNYYRQPSRFRLTFVGEAVNIISRIRGAGPGRRVGRLSLPILADPIPSARPSNSKKEYRQTLAKSFGVYIEHVPCASVRRCSTVIPNETNAPERVLRATGQYSICHWREPFTDYVPVISPRALTKSVGYKAVGRLLGLEEGSRGVS